MNTTHTRTKVLTATVGAAVAAIAALALPVLGAGTATAFNPQPDPPGITVPSDEVRPGVPGLPSHGHGEDGGVIAIIAPAPHPLHH